MAIFLSLLSSVELLGVNRALAAPLCANGTDGTITIAPPLNDVGLNVYFAAPDPTVEATELAAGSKEIKIDSTLGAQAPDLHSSLSTDIQRGDTLLIIQMMGVDIDESGNQEEFGAYGDGQGGLQQAGQLSDNFHAGLYEYVVATDAPTNGVIPIAGQGAGGGLINSYYNSNVIATNSGFRRYQVIRVPQFRQLTLSSRVSVVRWNGRWGGVAAIDVGTDFIFEGEIDASGSGFRGGQFRATSSSVNWGSKGEGIAGMPAETYSRLLLEENAASKGEETGLTGYPGTDGFNGQTRTRDTGLGAPGNAGSGGGGRIDSGGGGGGNAGRGGDGGRGTDFGREGDGGANFPQNLGATVSRFALGGGGGGTNSDSAADNDAIGQNGQAGGGIVMIRTASFSASDGSVIKANGDSSTTGLDVGGGGGGAAGTVFIHTRGDTINSLNVQIMGGDGGSSVGVTGGAGGGGSGGYLWLSGTDRGDANIQITAGQGGAATSDSNSRNGDDGEFGEIHDVTNAIPAYACEFSYVGIAKELTNIERVSADTTEFDLSFTIVVENFDSTALTGLQIRDDLSKVFPGAASIAVQGVPVLDGLTAPAQAFNASTQAFLLSGDDSLAPAEVKTLSYTVRVDVAAMGGQYMSSAEVGKVDAVTEVFQSVDISANGSDPDPDGDGDPFETLASGDEDANIPTNIDIDLSIPSPNCVFTPPVAKSGDAVTASCSGLDSGDMMTIAGMTCGAENAGVVSCSGTAGNGMGGTVTDNALITNQDSFLNKVEVASSFTVDTDGDGTRILLDPDDVDACNPNPLAIDGGDCDMDGTLNVNEVDATAALNACLPSDIVAACDTDNDMVPDGLDAFPNDPNESADTDNDGIGDNADPAPEDSCLPSPVLDGDDCDNDGLNNGFERLLATDPLNPDTDGDGLSDGIETGGDADIAMGETQPLDLDTDDDGLSDAAEDANRNGMLDAGETSPVLADTDGDGLQDGLELGVTSGVADPDADGPLLATGPGFIPDADPTSKTDPTLADTDSDGLSDGQEDADKNGLTVNMIGATGGMSGSGESDPNIADTDGDGLSDGDEVNQHGSSPLDTDTDDGGTLDGTEINSPPATDPLNPKDDLQDLDKDGITDRDEVKLGTDYLDADTDNDGLRDGQEIQNDGSYDEGVDTSPLDADTDDDGLSDGQEAIGFGPLILYGPTNPLSKDTDNDGIEDGIEAGLPANGIAPGVSDTAGIAYLGTMGPFTGDADANSVTDPTNDDTDGDGLKDGEEDLDFNGAVVNQIGDHKSRGSGETDPASIDTDGDGLSDGDEALGRGPLEGLGMTDPLDTDTDNGGSQDGIEVLADDTNPTAGNGDDDLRADPDFDGLNTEQEIVLNTDPRDADTDNDGIDDGDEIGNDASFDAGDTDPKDADSDDDGLSDGVEKFGIDNIRGSGDETDPSNPDTDNDGLSDGLELGITQPVPGGMSDDAGILFNGTNTNSDNYRVDANPASRTNPLSTDSDGDGLADGVEDINLDGAATNTIGGKDTTGSGETAAHLADTDGDGLSDGIEVLGIGPLADYGKTDPLDTDTDDGGTQDGAEVLAVPFTNPTAGNPGDDPAADPDDDGLSTEQELELGTDPANPDSDGDGIKDGREVGNDGVLNPGIDSNPLDADTDDDGLSDGQERLGPDGFSGSGDETEILVADTDMDGLSDGLERGVTTPISGGTTEPGGMVFQGTDTDSANWQPDSDPDTQTDPRDNDTDNDGLQDGIEDANADGATINTIGETGTDGSGESDPLNTDTDGDGLSDGNEVLATGPLEGIGATDPLDVDTDDGTISDGIEIRAGSNPLDPADDRQDRDGDAVIDAEDEDPKDPCLPNFPSPTCTDMDGDGAVDSSIETRREPREINAEGDTDPCSPNRKVLGCDTDKDGLPDGIEDANNNFMVDRGESNPNSTDSDGDGLSDTFEAGGDIYNLNDLDGDGLPDLVDSDSDNDRIPDIYEVMRDPLMPPDTDGDGIADYLDRDSDNDGIPDGSENSINLILPSLTDDNNNSILDDLEAPGDPALDLNSNGIRDDLEPSDSDRDGIPDALDPDSDNDGIPDALEIGFAPGGDADGDGIADAFDFDLVGGGDGNIDGVSDVAVAIDTDGDGTEDYRSKDSDGDGISDWAEFQSDEANMAVSDTDGDQIVDRYDVDILGGVDENLDGIDDSFSDGEKTIEAIDTDQDGASDYQDLDSDNDGLTDVNEATSNSSDKDGNGLVDIKGVMYLASNLIDSDADGVRDFRDTDSDQDGIFDLASTIFNSLDQNNDGSIDEIGDEDKDGIVDQIDYRPKAYGTAVTADENFPDFDQDGIPDLFDLDNDNDGIPNIEEGNGAIDSDEDGNPDSKDLDSDGDGIPDLIEAGTGNIDANGDQVLDNMIDENFDGLSDSISPTFKPVDSDGDGAPDFQDLNSDNDALDDSLEGADYFRESDGAKLKTGASTGGSFDAGFLLFALLILLIRRFNRKTFSVALKKKLTFSCLASSFLLAIALGISSPQKSIAQDFYSCQGIFSGGSLLNDCFSFGVGMGAAQLKPDGTDGNGWYGSSASGSSSFNFDIAWQMNSRWFSELSIAQLGEVKLENDRAPIATAFPDAAVDYSASSLMFGLNFINSQGFGLGGNAGYAHKRSSKGLKVFAKAGFAQISTTPINDGDSVLIESESGSGAAFGFGTQYNFRAAGVFLSLSHNIFSGDASTTVFSIGKTFGGTTKIPPVKPKKVVVKKQKKTKKPKSSIAKKAEDTVKTVAKSVTPVKVQEKISTGVFDVNSIRVAPEQEKTLLNSTFSHTLSCARLIDTARNTKFKPGSDKLTSKARRSLKVLAKDLKKNPNLTMQIQTTVLSTGSANLAKKLSQRRAEAIADYLIDRNVREQQIKN